MEDLTDRHLAILDFETQKPLWKHAGAHDTAIFEELGLTPTRYAQILNWLLDHPSAEAYAPQTVHRLQRLRETRQRQCTAGGVSARQSPLEYAATRAAAVADVRRAVRITP